MKLHDKNKEAAAEAVLFACGETVNAETLAKSIEVDINELSEIINSLNENYSKSGSSLQVLHYSTGYQIATRKEFANYIRNAMEAKKDTPLSSAAMESLTIIAYNQPVSKSFVSHVRGVESGGIVNSLAERGLIEEAGRLDVPGKPVAFKTTDNFLRCFGLESLEDLIPIPETININNNQNNINNTEDSEERGENST